MCVQWSAALKCPKAPCYMLVRCCFWDLKEGTYSWIMLGWSFADVNRFYRAFPHDVFRTKKRCVCVCNMERQLEEFCHAQSSLSTWKNLLVWSLIIAWPAVWSSSSQFKCQAQLWCCLQSELLTAGTDGCWTHSSLFTVTGEIEEDSDLVLPDDHQFLPQGETDEYKCECWVKRQL